VRKIKFKRTGIEVTELCFGALPMGPAQKNMLPEDSAEVLSEALRLGVNFVDTAQMYKTYEPIRMAIEKTGIRPVIASKSAATTYEEMESAIVDACKKMGVDYVDIFLLHAARSEENVFDNRAGAVQCLIDYKQKGVIKAVGISTHRVQTVVQAAMIPDIDIVFPILNKIGMGILGGTREDMESAIRECAAQDKDVYIMKALAGGNLIDDYKDAIDYVRTFSEGHMPIAMGMTSVDEVRMNVKLFNNEDVSEQSAKIVRQGKKFYIVPSLCKRCGQCAEACHSRMITRHDDGVFSINESQCLRCGYCVTACPQFAIRMV